MALTSRVSTHIYEISTGLRASGEPPAQGPDAPGVGSATPLANLLAFILPFLIGFGFLDAWWTERHTPPIMPPVAGEVINLTPLAFPDSTKTDYSTIKVDTAAFAPSSSNTVIDSLWVGQFTFDPDIYDDSLSAFLGFEPCRGWGCDALKMARDSVIAGDWELKIWEVTSLATDEASGNLASAVDSARANPTAFNIILITVGGASLAHNEGTAHIKLDSLHNTLIVGQTARGRGFTSRRQFEATSDSAPTNIVIRHLDIRVDGGRCLRTIGADSIVLDHMGGSHCGSGSGGGIFEPGDAKDTIQPGKSVGVTVQHGLHSWAAPRFSTVGMDASASYPKSNPCEDGHPAGANCNRELQHKAVDGFTYYGNAMLGPSRRMPHIAGSNTGVYEHIDYNSDNTQMAALRTGTGDVDFIGFYGKRGPGYNSGDGNWISVVNFSCWDSVNPPDTANCPRSIHASNIRVSSNNYDGDMTFAELTTGAASGGDSIILCLNVTGINADTVCGSKELIPGAWLRDDTLEQSNNPFARWTWRDMTDARRDSILDYSGDAMGLTCDGKWSTTIDGYTRRTDFDAARVQEFADSTGESSGIDPSAEGYEPDSAYRASGGEVACADADSDFLPDTMEKLISGDPDDSTSIAADGVCGRYGRLCIEYYLDGGNYDYLTIFYGDSGYLPDSIQVRVNGNFVENITPVEGRAQRTHTGLLAQWEPGDSVQVVQFGVCPDDLGYRITWTDNSDNEEWFMIFRDSGAGKVLVDSVGPNVTTYDDAAGREGDQYYVASKNVTVTSDTILVATGGCT